MFEVLVGVSEFGFWSLVSTLEMYLSAGWVAIGAVTYIYFLLLLLLPSYSCTAVSNIYRGLLVVQSPDN
jgi:hypothetical protein